MTRRSDRRRMADELRAHYAAAGAPSGTSGEGARDRVADLVAEAVRACPPRPDPVAFVRAQLRFIRPASWAMLAAAMAVGVAASFFDASRPAAMGVSAAGALAALACLPEVVGGRARGMVELEGACAFNAHAVACARLAVMGAAAALALTVAMLACARLNPTWTLVAYAAAPYFISCAGGLLVARRVSSADSLTATITWSSAVCAACAVAGTSFWEVYDAVSAGVWCLAAAVAAVWCAREVALWLRQSSAPFESARAAGLSASL